LISTDAGSLGNVSITIEDGSRTAVVNVDTDSSDALLHEDADGNIVVSIDSNGDGIYETPLSAPSAFVENSNGSLLIILAVIAVVVIALVFILLGLRRRKKQSA